MSEKTIELIVGLFVVAGIGAVLFLGFKVSGLTSYNSGNSYQVTAEFENIGDLKRRAPVTVAGVKIGQVTGIRLDKENYKAVVTMKINETEDNIPADSSLSIVTAGLLGANFISLSPGFDEEYLQNGDEIMETHPALQIETMIGQLLFNMNKEDERT